MLKKIFLGLFLAGLVVNLGVAVPFLVNYQGKLTDTNGKPITGQKTVIFKIYESETAINPSWQEEHTITFSSLGLFTVKLGSKTSLADLDFGKNYWLEIQIEGTVFPRQQIVSVFYSFRAQSAEKAKDAERLGGRLANEFAEVNHTHPPADHGTLEGLEDNDHPQYVLKAEISIDDGNPPNEGTNQVHWNNLNGVPTGFADGVDDTGGTVISDHGELTGLEDDDHPQYALDTDLAAHSGNASAHHSKTTSFSDLTDEASDEQIPDTHTHTDGSIEPADVAGTAWTRENDGSGSGLDADLLDGQEASAFASAGHTHDDRYYTEGELRISDGDSPNQGTNRVHWNNLNGVPAGFADGQDNGDNLGNHTATRNLILSGHWLSGDEDNEGIFVDTAGKVGIGTNTPEFKLSLDRDGGIIAKGAFGEGLELSTAGAGTRLIWYPGKAAFRAGYVEGQQWNDGNIGSYSTALGHSTRASGRCSTALGIGTKATNEASTALGHYTEAFGLRSTAMGESTRAHGPSSTAMGSNTTASGHCSTAMGGGTRASGSCSTAMGDNTHASGHASTTMGRQTIAQGYCSTAIGEGIRAEGRYSVAIALDSEHGTRVSQDRTMAIMGGRVGIGTVAPQALLHVNGNACKPGGGDWDTPSDLRLKDIQGGYEKGLAEIVQLKPVRFRYKADNPRRLPSDTDEIGFIGQEIEKIFPEAVSKAEDGYLDFNMHPVNVAVINAIKELKAENEKLKARIEELENFLWPHRGPRRLKE